LVFEGKPLVAAEYSLAKALKAVRKARGLSQEAFSDVSSRTYMSTLERDLKSPTLSKLVELCEVMDVHPITLLTLAYTGDSTRKTDELLAQVQQELDMLIHTDD
jgi:transcriptional regulator with XRE-family HTH domain|tara:strand:+ start:2371 stop:2682 length:312 start_codon:yes stop_codon:yes gene_type:complete